MTGWGVVGTGEVATAVAEDLALVEGAERVAVGSRQLQRAVEFAARSGFRDAGSFDQLLANPDVDVVYIATPHATHAGLVVTALAAGKHVLVEKPAGVDEAEVRIIQAAAMQYRRFAMEAMWMRFNPAYQRLLTEVRAGAIGRVSSVRASFGIPFPPDVGSRWSPQMRGSTLLDQGVYPLTLALDVLGWPDSLQAHGTVRSDGVDVRQHVTLEYEDHRFAQLAVSMVEFVEPTGSVSGERGWMTLPFPFWAADRLLIHRGRGLFRPDVLELPHEGHGYVPMLRAVQQSIAGGLLESEIHPWQDVIARHVLLDRIRAHL